MRFGADEVLELQRDLGAFLREFAILKRVGKLGFFADADQELRLRQQSNRLKPVIATARAQGREVHVRGDVLLAGSFVGRRTGLMATVGHQGVAMAPGELLFARVAVVDQDDEILACR